MVKSTVTLLFLLMLSTPAFAETPVFTLPEIVTTASRWEEPRENVTQDMTVITQEEIEKKKVPFVIDLLRSQPDMQIVQNGGPGTNATLFLRGGSGNQTLVLIDGIKLNSPSTGSADLSNLMTTDVERIEIIKGSQSTLYGSEAMAGVVNIITKKGSGKLKADLSSEGGSFNTFKTAGTVAGGTDKYNYRLTASWFDTDGISVARSGTEPDGYSNRSVSTRLGANPTANTEVDLNLRYGADTTHLDDFQYGTGPVDSLTNIQKRKNYLASATGKMFLWGKYEQDLALSYLHDELREDDPIVQYNNIRLYTTTEQLDWQHILDLQPLTVIGGFAYRYESAKNKGAFDNSTDNRAGYLNAKLELLDKTLILNAGMRCDDHSTFGTAVTWRSGLLYHVKPIAMRLKANFGTGFRAPSLNELYYPFYGNPDLQPEKSKGGDIGLEKDLFDKKMTIGATWFMQSYHNLIQSNPNTNYTADNIGRARSEGVEFSMTVQPVADVKFNAAYAYLEAMNLDTDEFLTLRPRNKITSSVEYTHAGFMALCEYLYVSKRHDASANRDLSPYSLVNLKASYAFDKHIGIFARIDNLFDKSYEEVAGYGTPRFSVFGGVKVTF